MPAASLVIATALSTFGPFVASHPYMPSPIARSSGSVSPEQVSASLKHRTAAVQVTGHEEVPTQRCGHFERELGVVTGHRRRERRVDVLSFDREHTDPFGLVGAGQPLERRLHEVGEVLRMTNEGHFQLPGLDQSLAGVCVHRLQQVEPHARLGGRRDDERLVDQSFEHSVDDVRLDRDVLG